jgi:TolB-like protein
MIGRLLDRFLRFLAELRRRKVYQVAVGYVIVGFMVIEAADLTLVRLGLPPWTVTLVIVLVGLGFPIALVLAWALEVTPEGVRVDTAEEAAEGETRAQAPATPSLWAGASVLALLLLGAWWLFADVDTEKTANKPEKEIHDQSIAVLPFEVSGAGAEEGRDGMVTTLSLNLDGAAGLRAVADRTVFAAWNEAGGTEEGTSTEEALAVAQEVGARYAIVGSAVQLGENLRFAAQIRETGSGERLGQVEVEGSLGSVTALTDRLTRRVLGVLFDRSEEAIPSVSLESITTESLPALKAFLEGGASLSGWRVRGGHRGLR